VHGPEFALYDESESTNKGVGRIKESVTVNNERFQKDVHVMVQTRDGTLESHGQRFVDNAK